VNQRAHILRRLRSSLAILALLVPTLLLTGYAQAQAVPAAGGIPMGDAIPEDQPLMGQQLGTNLTLNQSAGATNAENEAFNRYGFGVQAEGGAQTNFFGTQTNQQTVAYTSFSVDAGLNLRTPRTRYYLLYQPRYTVYPQYSDVNNFAQTAFQSLTHAITQHVGVGWDSTASRYLSLDQFLPQSLSIGGIGIVAPNIQSQLLQNSFEVTNAATSLRLRYLMSAKMTFTASGTGAFFLSVPVHVQSTGTGFSSQRFLTGGADMRLDDQITMRDSIGAEFTPVYIDGLTPKGHLLAETLQAVYKRQLTATTSISVAGGPLFYQSSTRTFGSSNQSSYAVNAILSRQIRQSQLSVGYSRAFVVSFLSPAVVANQASLNAYVPMRNHWLLTSAFSYSHMANGGAATLGSQYGGYIYGGSAQLAYLLGSRAQIYGLYALNSENLSYGQPQAYIYTQNKFGAGIRFNLGNPTTRGGTQ
jgi:hypothetical protein